MSDTDEPLAPAPTEPEDTLDLTEALELLGLSEGEVYFDGYLGEADLITLRLMQGQGGYLVEASGGYGSENWFFDAGDYAEDAVDIGQYMGEYELTEYQWEEMAESMLSEEAHITTDVADITAQPEELEEECEEIKQKIAQLESILAGMKDEQDELEEKLNGAEIEGEKLEAEKEDLEDKKASCPGDITALQNEIPLLESGVEGMVEALNQAVNIYQDCSSRYSSGSSRCRGHLECVGQVYRRLQELKNELAVKGEALKGLQKECVELDSRIHLGITPKISQLNQAIQNYETDIAHLSVQIAELDSRIEQIKERYQECIDELEELEKRRNRANKARRKAEHAAGDAERKVDALKKRYDEFRGRFPDGVYPGDMDKYRERIEEIKDKINDAATGLDEEKVDEAKGEAGDLAREAEREKERLNKYWLANICLANCDSACRLCSQSVDNLRARCGLSEYFTDVEQALGRLEECCRQVRQELVNGNIEDARQMCIDCLREQQLARAVHDALKKACTDRLTISHLDVSEDGDLEGMEELIDFEKNIGLQAIGELGKIPSTIIQAIEAGKIIGDQQKNACCALVMMKHMLTSRNYFEAAVYADAFVHFWQEISGLPEIPTARTAAALGLAEIIDDMPEERKESAIAAIEAVLQSARCAGAVCY